MSFSGIAAAARRQGNRSLESFAITRAYSPKADEQTKQNLKNRADIESAGKKAAHTVKTAENRAELQQMQVDAKIDAAKIKKEGKKAGKAGAAIQMAGKVAAAALMKTPDPIKPVMADRSATEAYFRKQQGILNVDKAKPFDPGSTGDALPGYDPNKTYGSTGSKGTRMAGSVANAGSGASTLTGDAKYLADKIAGPESGSWGYDAFNQGGKDGGRGVIGKSGSHKEVYGKSLTDMTLGEIFHKQNTKARGLSMDQHLAEGGLHAVGRYQFIGDTLQNEVAAMGLSHDTKFTPEVQDKIFLSHAKRVGNISPWIGPMDKYGADEKSKLNSIIQGL